jgi:hypothetical protein
MLIALHVVADEGRLVGLPLGIDHDRQIAADAERIHVIEEERPMPAQEILHVVLRGREQNVHAGVIHQAIEPCGIERDGMRFRGSDHEGLLGGVLCWGRS